MTTIALRAESRRPLERLLSRAEHGADSFELDLSSPIDHSRWFVCPTATPLYYAAIYQQLSEADKRRYNQLTAVCFNELIVFFETTFALSVLSALRSARLKREDAELSRALAQFIAEEQEHTRWWNQLSRASRFGDDHGLEGAILRVPRLAKFLLARLTKHPQLFPAAFWIMLALEERSLDISQRCLRMNPADIEPHYREVYRKHLEHEIAHVHIDWQLIELYYANRGPALRRFNARLLRTMIGKFFLPPVRSASRVVSLLVSERPHLGPLQPRMRAELREVGRMPAYHEMMYSRESTPLTFKLFDRFPEMHAMSGVLSSYSPLPEAARP